MGHLVSNFQSSGSGFPLTRALNFGTNADRWCVVHVFFTSGLTLSDVTANGVGLTQRATGAGMGGGTHRVYEGSVAGTGSLNVEATGTGGGVCWMTCAAYDGVSGYRASSVALKTSTAGTDNITAPTTVAGDFVWCGGNDNTASAIFAGTAGTSTLAANAGEFAVGKTATGTSTQLDFTVTPSGTWQGGVLALVPTPPPAGVAISAVMGDFISGLSLAQFIPSSLTIGANMDAFLSGLALAQAPGTINFGPLKNGSGFRWDRSDITAVVRDRTTDAVVATVAGVVSGPTGGAILAPGIASGGLYRVTFKIPAGGALPSGAKGDADLAGA